MKQVIACLGAVMALSACDPTDILDKESRVPIAEDVCERSSSKNCVFFNTPVRLTGDPIILPKRPYKFFRTANSLDFIDGQGRRWIAPNQTLTDGASIPKIFINIIGDPTSPEFVNAAAVHDAYCGIGNENGPNFHNAKWEDVHRMFYEALIVSGTPRVRASIMFTAVYLGGPRWDIYKDRDISKVPTPALQNTMRQAMAYIEKSDPPFGALWLYLQMKERQLQQTYVRQAFEEHEEEHGHDDDGYTGYPGTDPSTGLMTSPSLDPSALVSPSTPGGGL
ncbi:DUF1353 domain-containing protein [Mesobacterium sp. TK19101]|uniref:DUF1353 domain-containing protein n=1 Tax=Mesobacterium hydrothermale TaxID=3111907 RepID=A0ABU6HGQ5_9RHOB|nr:DUF1353 domain-containing protein [Mesobacterium sp. TK19101]MEC3861541.1 DUF1353 domain-containing protein [Mesobacterium sp. TK19101]